MQFPTGKPALGVIYDSSMGTRIDEALGMAVLYGLDGKEECRVVGVGVSKANLRAAALAEVIGRFYAGAVSGAIFATGRTLPVGLSVEGKLPEDTPMLAALDRKREDGKPAYEHGIHHLNDTAEVQAVIRNALTAQHDENAAIVMAGAATDLAQVLALPGARQWVERKVCLLALVDAPLYWQADLAAARQVLAGWPAPVVAAGEDIARALVFPGASIEKDFAWNPMHPVADTYRAAAPMPYDAPAPAMAAVLYAVRGEKSGLAVSEPGTIEIGDDGKSRFTASAGGRHRMLRLDAAQKAAVLRTCIELASARPVVRQRRFPRQQQQQQQQQQQTPPVKKP